MVVSAQLCEVSSGALTDSQIRNAANGFLAPQDRSASASSAGESAAGPWDVECETVKEKQLGLTKPRIINFTRHWDAPDCDDAELSGVRDHPRRAAQIERVSSHGARAQKCLCLAFSRASGVRLLPVIGNRVSLWGGMFAFLADWNPEARSCLSMHRRRSIACSRVQGSRKSAKPDHWPELIASHSPPSLALKSARVCDFAAFLLRGVHMANANDLLRKMLSGVLSLRHLFAAIHCNSSLPQEDHKGEPACWFDAPLELVRFSGPTRNSMQGA